jgi:Sigma-70, region 4
MTTLREFEDALREQGMNMALAILERLRQRDRATRSAAPPRRVRGTKMTPELARQILELHRTTELTQQEIAFKLGVNQGRVNEVIKHGKWLSGDQNAPEAVARDKALARAAKASRPAGGGPRAKVGHRASSAQRKPRTPGPQAQLTLGEF